MVPVNHYRWRCTDCEQAGWPAHTQPAPDAIAAVRAKTPPDLRAVVGFEPYQGMERARGRLRRVQRPAQFPTN